MKCYEKHVSWETNIGVDPMGQRAIHFNKVPDRAPDSWALDDWPNCLWPNCPLFGVESWALGSNCPGPDCPGPNLPRTVSLSTAPNQICIICKFETRHPQLYAKLCKLIIL